jgi:BirA family transcriptional regulator, biotin operon repressor / biotin---[acetyl-CoA-carboxylase] ligase
VRFVILGIGVNLNARRDDFPPELRTKATSLALVAGRPIDRACFTGRLLTQLERRYGEFCRNGFAKIAPVYERFHCLAGRRVRVEGGVRRVGTARGIDASGALLVECGGRLERVVAGEVTLAGSYRTLGSKALAISRRRA